VVAGGVPAIFAAMEDVVETLTRGNVAEVKVVLATVALALGLYQLAVIAVGYGKLSVPFLAAPPAFKAHRAVGDTIALLLLCTGVMCVSVYGFEADKALHAVAGSALLTVLAVKVSVVRREFGLGRFLPVLGITVFLVLCLTWATSAGAFLA
jgi:hypothetical protein